MRVTMLLASTMFAAATLTPLASAEDTAFKIPEGWIVSPQNQQQPGEAGYLITHEETGMELAFVPASRSMMGSDKGGDHEKPIHEVELSGYWIGRTEVTVWQWRKVMGEVRYLCVNEQGESHPIVGVNWHQAGEFCEKMGLRLPTEAEWEYAARGPEGRIYPWGDEWSPRNCCNGKNKGTGSYESTFPVGSMPYDVSWCGVLDMGGNVLEWCSDRYGAEFYAHSPDSDPTGPDEGEQKVLRGGSWRAGGRGSRSTHRGPRAPDWDGFATGFRCARGL